MFSSDKIETKKQINELTLKNQILNKQISENYSIEINNLKIDLEEFGLENKRLYKIIEENEKKLIIQKKDSDRKDYESIIRELENAVNTLKLEKEKLIENLNIALINKGK